MKRGAVLLTLLAVMVTLCGCALPVSGAVVREMNRELNAFDPVAEGLVEVRTVPEGSGSAAYCTLASGKRIMETGEFSPDEMRFFTVDSFSWPVNGNDSVRVRDEEGREAPMTREIDAICRAMREIGHSVIQCRVFYAGDECFVSVMLNVNLWTPYRFYWFSRESGRLILLYVFANRDADAIHVLNREGLWTLNQEGIGGWPDSGTAAD